MCVRIACVQASSPTPNDDGLDLCISHSHPFGCLLGSHAFNDIVKPWTVSDSCHGSTTMAPWNKYSTAVLYQRQF